MQTMAAPSKPIAFPRSLARTSFSLYLCQTNLPKQIRHEACLWPGLGRRPACRRRRTLFFEVDFFSFFEKREKGKKRVLRFFCGGQGKFLLQPLSFSLWFSRVRAKRRVLLEERAISRLAKTLIFPFRSKRIETEG